MEETVDEQYEEEKKEEKTPGKNEVVMGELESKGEETKEKQKEDVKEDKKEDKEEKGKDAVDLVITKDKKELDLQPAEKQLNVKVENHFKKNLNLMKKASKLRPVYTRPNSKKRRSKKKKKKVKKNHLFLLPKVFSNFAQKDIYHDIYHINYNRIGGLETYPGKFNILITDPKMIRNSRNN